MKPDGSAPHVLPSELQALPSALETEVVGLFDEFRCRLLRYALSFGLSVHDGEEVIQEVFLALHRHLQRGGSRKKSWPSAPK